MNDDIVEKAICRRNDNNNRIEAQRSYHNFYTNPSL